MGPKPRRQNRKQRRAEERERQLRTGPEISYWLVAFLDLLGYRGVLDEMDVLPLPADPGGVAQITQALARAMRIRRRLHAAFEQFMKGYDLAPADELQELPPDLRDLATPLRATRLVKATGPDHYVVAASLAPSKLNFPMRSVYAAVVAAASGMLIQLAMGANDATDTLPLRGGIDIAAGAIGMPENFLYTPALTRAYLLEGSAKYPRTLIGERVVDLIEQVLKLPNDDMRSVHARQVAERLKNMFFTDRDGKLVLDFYGPVMRETLETDFARDIGRKAWKYATSAEQLYRQLGDQHVTEKYEWLAAYMAERRKLWE
jgi:hypothetical protein